MFRYFDTEGLTDNDELWDPRYEEPFPHFRARGRAILDRVFKSDKPKCKGLITPRVDDCYLFISSCFHYCPS